MVWAVPALAAATLCLRVSTDLVKVTVAALIFGAVLSKAEHPQLGVCDLEPGTIGSDPSTLDQLKLCPALTGAQQDALNALLLSGRSEYGDPSSWDLQTLHDLGPLVLALNQTTLSLVAEAAREDFRSLAASSIAQGHSQRDKSLLPLGAAAASRPRLKRSSDRCQSDPITAKNIDEILILSLEQLDLCLSNDVLIKNLEGVVVLPITSEISQVLKKKVDEVFPSGLPEQLLRRLGTLSRLYTEQEISQWPVTSSDTLSALLSPSGGQWDDSQVQQLISRYLALGGSWSGPLLQEMGGKQLCQLQEEQIQQIPAAAVGTAGQLDISTCSQAKKEQLYGKAREAFASLGSSPSSYYCRIRPYLGGAPAEDLKELANAGVAINMDLHTFLALNPEELQKLSVTDVKRLLGENLPELKKAEHEPSVESWVQKQSQRELDCVLGIGLQGGQPAPAGTASPAPATATGPVPATPNTATTPATATGPVPATPNTATTPATATGPVPATPNTATTPATATGPVPATPNTATTPATATGPVPATPNTATTPATATGPVPATPNTATTPATATGPVPATPNTATTPATATGPVPATPNTATTPATATGPVPATPNTATTPATATGPVPATPNTATTPATATGPVPATPNTATTPRTPLPHPADRQSHLPRCPRQHPPGHQRPQCHPSPCCHLRGHHRCWCWH
ncbi:PREDICTED: mesothelin-like protein [Ficedula albicollis]|uniref:mesothelin-like protein n=1 Tax=Ficedula albicollis TaxID=59894 RepID=UPI0007AD9087|nr:PREDICTED: mesothelin-like protein [Ficedula albicollis]